MIKDNSNTGNELLRNVRNKAGCFSCGNVLCIQNMVLGASTWRWNVQICFWRKSRKIFPDSAGWRVISTTIWVQPIKLPEYFWRLPQNSCKEDMSYLRQASIPIPYFSGIVSGVYSSLWCIKQHFSSEKWLLIQFFVFIMPIQQACYVLYPYIWNDIVAGMQLYQTKISKPLLLFSSTGSMPRSLSVKVHFDGLQLNQVSLPVLRIRVGFLPLSQYVKYP